MAFDYKKEYKEFYMPKGTPSIVTIPKMNYIAVRGRGNPDDEDGAYKQAIGLLYAIAFTIKMSKKGDHQINGYFDYVVPPLEGFWWQDERHPVDAMVRTDRAGRQDGAVGIDYAHKDAFQWISVIRLRTLSQRKISIGQLEKRRQRRNRIFQRLSFLPTMKDCAYNACISGRMMMSLPQ